MKIIFICGSMEPGHDGVGDYTRMLAAELINSGQEVSIASIHDNFIEKEKEEIQVVADTKVAVLRIPGSYNNKRRAFIAKNWINLHNPEWISLQYVPYSYEKRGLPFSLPSLLEELGMGRKWHIMFHELWIGISKISPIEHRFFGFFQSYIAKRIVTRLHPTLVTTSNRLYQVLLEEQGIKADILSLFSNIPVADIEPLFLKSLFHSLSIEQSDLKSYHIAGIFGSIYPGANLKKAIAEQLLIAKTNQQQLIVLGFGQVSDDGLKEFEVLKFHFTGRVLFCHLGKLSSDEVSMIMQTINISLSCTPAPHLGKSGVFAALKLHGLQVITAKDEFIPEYNDEIERYNKKIHGIPASNWSVETVSKSYIELIKNVH